jgi:hypothetical protein
MVSTIDRLLIKLDIEMSAFDRKIKGIQRILLSLGLSMTFTGMAIERFFMGIMSKLYQIFMEINGELDPTVNQINNLQASVIELAWSLMDAFAESGKLQEWIDKIKGLTDWFDKLTTSTKGTIVNFMVWAIVLGFGAMILGQLSLGFLAFLKVLGIANGLFVILFGSWSLFFRTIAALAIFVFANPIGIAIVAILGLFILLTTYLGSVKLAFKAMGIFILAILAGIGDIILEAVILPVRALIALLNLVMKASNKLFGTNFQMIEQPEAFNLSKKVYEMRNNLLNEAGRETTPAPSITNNITVEGSADQNVINTLIKKIEDSYKFYTGSPQAY